MERNLVNPTELIDLSCLCFVLLLSSMALYLCIISVSAGSAVVIIVTVVFQQY